VDLVNDKLYADCMLVVVLSSINDVSVEDRFFVLLYFEWLSVAHYSVCASDFILILYFVEFSFT
jgi:hypothetical protein